MKVYLLLASFILLDVADIPAFPASGCSCSDDVEYVQPTDNSETEMPSDQSSDTSLLSE